MTPLKREYEYFLLLCETLNISIAAEKAGIQQAGLSKSLKSLELHYDQPLFYRTNRGLIITPYGEILKNNLIKIQESWDEKFEKDLSVLDEIGGRYTLGVHPTIAISHLNKFYPKLLEKQSSLSLHLEFQSSNETIKDIIEHKLNFGIVASAKTHPDLVMIKLVKEMVCCWSTTAKPKNNIIYYNPDMINIIGSLKRFKDHRLIPVDSYEVIVSMADKTNGMMILPEPVARKNKKLNKVGPKLFETDICLIFRHDMIKTKSTRLIIDSVKEVFL